MAMAYDWRQMSRMMVFHRQIPWTFEALVSLTI
jgi:hypothetical protein